MKKVIEIILLLCISQLTLLSQWEPKIAGYDVNQPINIYFANPNTGWVLFESNEQYITDPISWRLYKTTDKGITWTRKTDINSNTPNTTADISFINENTGFLIYLLNDSWGTPYCQTLLTTNGGDNWTGSNYSNSVPWPNIKFINVNTGFLFGRDGTKLYKTTDRGNNWNVVFSDDGARLLDIAISPNNSNHIYVAGYKNGFYYSGNPFLIKNENGFANSNYITILSGENQNELTNGIVKIIITNESGVDNIKLATYKSLQKLLDLNGNLQTIYQYPLGMRGKESLNLNFSDVNNGYGYWYTSSSSIIKTTDGGSSWQMDLQPFYNYNVYNIDLKNISIIGNICHVPNWFGQVYNRKIHGLYNTNYDWRTGLSGSIAVDGQNLATPGDGYFRGGTTRLFALPYLENENHDTLAKFYYWGGSADASMDYNNHPVYLIYDNSQINADYKSYLKSTESNTLSNANQVKILKDTNGVTNLIYESMQGIFFTRTRPDGKYKAEEVVSGTNNNISTWSYATFQNSNPYLAEIKNNVVQVNKEKNLVACWERREGNNIKILIAYRVLDPLNRPSWALNDSITLENIPAGFKCVPKIMINNSLFPYDTKVVTYLKPSTGSNVKLAARVLYQSNSYRPELDVIQGTNLHEYAIASLPSFPGAANFELHLAYKVGQSIYYKKSFIGWDGQLGPNVFDIWNPVEISLDNSSQRTSIDIDLRNYANSNDPANTNMQPVVTYQGVSNVRIIIQNEDGPPSEIQGTYYPIYVRERITTGWAQAVIKYELPNVAQQTPNIVGSKLMNSCLLNFKRSSSYVQAVPRWNNSAPNSYRCDQNTFTGTDAKLMKCALVYSTNNGQRLTTLSPSSTIYGIDKQDFNVIPSSSIPAFDAITGIVVDENIRYSFNMGNIMVNWNSVGFSTDIDTVIEDTPDMNEGMRSENFLLNENDTLIIGRNAFYIVEGTSTPVEIEYKVKLMNKTLEQEHRLLVHDTLQSGDTLQIEFLEGYIIDNIPNGSDSFYVQLEVDTLDGDHGLIGGDGGGDGGGDNIAGRKMIFWEGKTPGSLSSNNLPREFNLYQNFPNPFNPETILKYDLPKDVNVSIKIYDLLGREVAQLVKNEFKKAGRYEAGWNARNFASGVYIYRIEAGDFIATKKMVLVK